MSPVSLQELRETITAQEAARRGSATLGLAPFLDSNRYVPIPVIDFYERLYVVNTFSSNLSPEKDTRAIFKASMELQKAGSEMLKNPLEYSDISCMLALSLVREAKRDVAAVKMTIASERGLEYAIGKNDLSSTGKNAHLKDQFAFARSAKSVSCPERLQGLLGVLGSIRRRSYQPLPRKT